LLGLPIIHLDQEYWQPDWVEPDAREWKRIVPQLAERPTWVMDGNYAGSLPVRLQACDAALFLDFPTWACFRGIASRRWRGGERLDMAAGCHERFNLEFYRFVWGFRRESRPKVVAQLEASEKPQLWMTHRAQVDTLLQRVSSEVA
jgi:adenylate kinase family enzyme